SRVRFHSTTTLPDAFGITGSAVAEVALRDIAPVAAAAVNAAARRVRGLLGMAFPLSVLGSLWRVGGGADLGRGGVAHGDLRRSGGGAGIQLSTQVVEGVVQAR